MTGMRVPLWPFVGLALAACASLEPPDPVFVTVSFQNSSDRTVRADVLQEPRGFRSPGIVQFGPGEGGSVNFEIDRNRVGELIVVLADESAAEEIACPAISVPAEGDRIALSAELAPGDAGPVCWMGFL